MYQESDLPLIEKRLRAWETAYHGRIAQLVVEYERPQDIFPDWLLPHPRCFAVTVTPAGAAIYAYAADQDGFDIGWLAEGLTAATDGFLHLDGPGAFDNSIQFAELGLVGTDPESGRETYESMVPWEHLWVTSRLRANDLRPEDAVVAAERDVLAFTTRHLLGLAQVSRQTADAGQIVAARLMQLAQEFEALLATATAEEQLQTFLRDNPAFLDLRAISVHPKVKLGAEYVTDFVIRLPGDEYVLVEIERSSHALYTQANNPSAPLTHAVQQVEDWLEWAYDNLTYLRSTLPGIHEPAGLVILGRRATLSDKATKALRRRNSSSKIRVVTFDDLLDQVRAVAANLSTSG